MITYKNDVFEINNEKQFIWGGELHYFRVKKEDWRDRIRKIKDAGFNLVSTYIPWLWHEKEEGVFDLTGEFRGETDLVSFIDMVKEEGMYLLVRPGPYVMAETVNSGLPLWLINEYPEIRARKENGEMHNNTGVVSFMHPTYLAHVKRWYEKVFSILVPREIQHGGPIIMTQYDNEVGMFHWVTQQGDYSVITLSYFKNYLIHKYATFQFDRDVEAFTSFEMMMKNYVEGHTSDHQSYLINQEYKLFFREYIRIYLEELITYASEFGSNVPPIVNVHGFSSVDYGKRGNRYPVGLSQLHETRNIKDVILAGDYYVGNIVSENYFDVILANSFTKAIQPQGQPLFSAEFQGGFQNGVPRLQPTTHDLKTRLTISNGMNAINYYMFVGGENFDEIGLISRRHDWQAAIGMDGSLRRHFYGIKRIVDVVKSYGESFLRSTPRTQTTLLFEPDYFMTEYNNKTTRAQASEMTRERQTYLYNGMGKSLAMNNITHKSIDILTTEKIDVQETPTLLVFSTKWMSKETQQKLADYLIEGGKLFLYPKLPEYTLTNEPCTILKDTIGVQIKEEVHQRVHILDEDSVNCHKAQVYDVTDGYAFLDLDHQKITGFIKQVGRGLVNVFGMAIKSDWDYIDEIIKRVLALFDIQPEVQTDEWLHVAVREDHDTAFYFIHNFEEFEKTATLRNKDEVLFGGHQFTIPFRKGVILPMNWKIAKDLTIMYSTCEVIHKEVTKDTVSITVQTLTTNETIVFDGEYEVLSSKQVEIHGNKIVLLEEGEVTLSWTKK